MTHDVGRSGDAHDACFSRDVRGLIVAKLRLMLVMLMMLAAPLIWELNGAKLRLTHDVGRSGDAHDARCSRDIGA